MNSVRIGVLTVSDRCSNSEATDESGPAIVDELPSPEFIVGYTAVVPDSKKVISSTLKRWVDEFDVDVILTTGGTGLSQRDITPEATRSVIDREAANIAGFLLVESLKLTPFAALSRGIAGVRKRTLIINLPGSPAGARDLTKVVRPLLGHAVRLLRGVEVAHPTAKSQD